MVHLVAFVDNYLYFKTLHRAAGAWLNPIGNAEFRTARWIGATIVGAVTRHAASAEEMARRYGYPFLFLIAVPAVAALLTLIWSIADRRRGDYEAMNRWLRLYARYALALVMLVYALVKVVPTQFGFLTPGELLKPVGQLNRFWMLWNLMVVSTGYTVFAGSVELIGCVLLFFRRTALLGALLLGAALTNVFAMDLAYRVLGAAMVAGLLLALDAIVVAPYAAPLLNIFLRGGAGPLPREPETQLSRWRYAPVAKVLLLVLLIAVRVSDGLTERRTYFGRGHAVYGLFDVDRFVRAGTTIIPAASDGKTWKRVGTDGRYDSAGVTVQFADSSVRQYRLIEDTAKQQWTLRDAGKDAATLHYTQAADGALSLEGQIGGEAVEIHLRRVDLNTLPLLRAR